MLRRWKPWVFFNLWLWLRLSLSVLVFLSIYHSGWVELRSAKSHKFHLHLYFIDSKYSLLGNNSIKLNWAGYCHMANYAGLALHFTHHPRIMHTLPASLQLAEEWFPPKSWYSTFKNLPDAPSLAAAALLYFFWFIVSENYHNHGQNKIKNVARMD